MTQKTKRCGLCKKRLPDYQFAPHAGNPDGHRHYCRNCRKSELAARKANQRAREKKVPGRLAVREVWHLIEFFAGHNCVVCGSEIKQMNQLSLDHVVPMSRGGRNGRGNILPMCLTCNMKKGAKPFLIYAAEVMDWDRFEALLRFLQQDSSQPRESIAITLLRDLKEWSSGV